MVPMLGAVLESTTGIKLRELIAGQGQPAGFAVLPTSGMPHEGARIEAVPASGDPRGNAGSMEGVALVEPTPATAPLNGHLEQAGAAPAAA